jgi:predicted nucleotidyltransferase
MIYQNMITLNKTEAILLSFLIRNRYSSYTIERIEKEINLPAPSIYRIIKSISKYINKENDKYSVNLKAPGIFEFKKLFDLENLNKHDVNFLENIKNELLSMNEGVINSIILFGSYADGTQNSDSDIDVLVITTKDLPLGTIKFANNKMNIVTYSVNSIISNPSDDFLYSIKLNNIIILDNYDYFKNLLIEGLFKIDINSSSFRNQIKLRFNQINSFREKVLKAIENNDEFALKKVKKLLLMKIRLDLLIKGIIVTTKSTLFRKYQEIFKINIKKIYENVDIKNLKSIVMDYGKPENKNLQSVGIFP